MSDVKTPGRDPAVRPTRRSRALKTRQRILDAARTLFYRDGYAATRIQQIADEAEVAVQTVYAVFGSKAAILEELRTVVVEQPVATDLFGAAVAATSPRERLRLFAASIRARWEAAGDIVRIHADAARVEPDARVSAAEGDARRAQGIARLSALLAADEGVALPEPRVRALLHALSLHAIYEDLVGLRGWSPQEYETWLREALEAQFLRG